MNYIDYLAEEIGKLCRMSMEDPKERSLLRAYAVLGLACGEEATSFDVHCAWSAWCLEHHPGHPSIRPFSNLTPEVQALDNPYRDAIRALAGQHQRMVR